MKTIGYNGVHYFQTHPFGQFKARFEFTKNEDESSIERADKELRFAEAHLQSRLNPLELAG